ncbi:MAG: glycoside hydrolase family 2 TIM barrel-domain containing protein [Actinomyces urogenitalis]|uniref:Beta-galactosidase n=2 Tax=root TaxID=1 RepID=A0A2I1KSM8_9ACTO|nr:glycoside hydrolase family 2 TIM barrel-domain containing protein [Actinomyces urogenitalis]MDU0972132.1 glycoside hydrolase family 2 TIM barrel-domain containing protein [Actinomyces urogenitalis]PKY98635.1 beta-galactosidase [Actinomyces urogenitalis]
MNRVVGYEQLSDPTFFAERRLPAHSDHRWYASQAEVERGESSFETCLDGVWKLAYSANLATAPEGFERDDVDVTMWDDAPVPAHIQMLGYERPQYANTQYPWDGHEALEPGAAPRDFNPVASYVRSFTLERGLEDGERLVLRLEGAESCVTVWLNGSYVGYSEDSFTPSEFDLTPYLRVGANRLALRVVKWCSGSWLEDQDFYRFSGLFRSVYLRRLPAAHLADLRTSVRVAPDLSTARVSVRTAVEGSARVTAHLEGVGELESDEEGTLSIEVDQPRLWSAEDPQLYDLTLRVWDAEGRLSEVVPQKVGLRRFVLENGVFTINGQRIVFRGVNRHEFGEQGRVMTRERTEADLIALKRANVNAIRTSHYPNNSFLYELCDRYGFYVIDETNLETHSMWDQILQGQLELADSIPGDQPQWLEAVLDRARSMYERDKNHPSILMWSCGNESYGGDGIAAMADLFRQLDSRPVHYEGVHWDPRRPETTDVVSQMYTPAATVEQFLATNRSKPMILCEYAHAMGNSFGAVDKYMDLAEREPLFQGAFIWDFADQAIRLTAPDGTAYWGYGGDCGEAPHDGDFCGNGIFYADHTPSPKIPEVAHVYQGLSAEIHGNLVTVTNRYLFTGSQAFECRVRLAREGRELAEAVLDTQVRAGHSATYELPLSVPEDAGEYTITVSFRLRQDTAWALAGHEVAWDQAVVEVAPGGSAGAVAERGRGPLVVDQPRSGALTLVEGGHNVGVHADGFDVLFSRITGALTSYRFGRSRDGGHELLNAPVTPCFWHAPTANERGYSGPFEEGAWLLASRFSRPVRQGVIPAVSRQDDAVEVTFVYELAGLAGSTCTMRYRVEADGTVGVTQVLDPVGEVPDLPEMSTLLQVPGTLSTLTWYGEGPDECYVDRRGGARLGVWTSKVSEQLPGYLTPQESGSHTGVRWARVTDERGRGLELRCDPGSPMELSALPWTPFEIDNARHPWELPTTGRTVLRPALMRRGVGGDDSWGSRTHPEYRLPSGPLEFRFTMRGVM